MSSRVKLREKLHGRGGPGRGQGRKPIGEKPMKKYIAMLDAETVRRARELGRGNLSAGLRLAVGRLNPPVEDC